MNFSKNSIFFSIILFKLVLLALFSSDYCRLLFIPFVDHFVSGNINPWQYYFLHHLNLDAFPYHAFMLYIFSVPMLIIHFLGIHNFLASNFLFKLPLFLADIGLLAIFWRLFPLSKMRVLLFYFLNPVIIYAIYIHSQLDIVPMAFLVTGIYFLCIEKPRYSAAFVGFALATKLHILVALPLLLFYVLKKYNYKEVLIYISMTTGVFLILDLPFIFSQGFFHMVLFNHKQSLMFDSFYKVGKLEILLPISAILMVCLHFINQKKVNQDLLFFYFGILFTATIFFIYPAPGWYVWLVPFTAIYFTKSEDKTTSILLYFSFSLIYLVFFIFFYQPDYHDILLLGHNVAFKIDNQNLRNIIFTILESMLIAVMYAFFRYGVRSNSIYKKQRNLIIGIGGDSGVGKSLLLDNLALLQKDKLLRLEGDGEHKWERGDKNWADYTHLDPKANYIHKQAAAIFELKNNRHIFRSEYDHQTGKFTLPLKVKPKEFIAISGLHPFYLPKLRKTIDLKIYLDTDETLRRHWKIIRDSEERGYSLKKAIQQIEARMDDAIKYIYPQKNFADLIINIFPLNNIELGKTPQKIELGLKIIIDASIHLEALLSNLDCEYNWNYNEDLQTQFVEFTSELNVDYEAIGKKLIPNIDEIVSINSTWCSGYNGLIQLVVIMMISEKLKEEN